MNTGMSSVNMRNVRDRTRSRYSRLATMRILLAMARHPRLDAACADSLKKNLVQRGLHQLESLDVRSGVDQPSEKDLCIGVRIELDLEVVVAVVAPPNERGITEQCRHAVVSAARQRQRDVPGAGGLLYFCHAPVEHLLAARDDAH